MEHKPDVFERRFELARLVEQEARSTGKSWLAVYLCSVFHNRPIRGRGSVPSAERILVIARSEAFLPSRAFGHAQWGDLVWQ